MGVEERVLKEHRAGRFGCLLSFVLAFALCAAAMWLAGILPGGENSAIYTDTMDQMAGMQSMLARQLAAGEDIFYSFESGMGQNTALIYAFCAFSPTTLLYLFISDYYTATLLGILLKLAVAALCFHLFLQFGLRLGGIRPVFFSLCYALCGFSFEYMLSTNLLDGLYLLPLVALAIMHALDKQRFTLLALAYAFSFLVNFYCGFVIGLFSAAAVAACLWLRDGRHFISRNVRFLFKYAAAVITAVLLSMCVLLPAICFFKNSTGFNNLAIFDPLRPWDVLYGLCFGRATSITTDIPFLYAGLPVLMLLPLYFSDSALSIRERWLAALVLISLPLTLYIHPLYLFLHAFNRPDGFTVRYAFIYVFFIVCIAAREACKGSRLKELTAPGIAGGTTLFLLLHALVALLHEYFGAGTDGKGISLSLWGGSAFILLWGCMALLLRYKSKIAIPATYVLLCVELLFQAQYNCREQGLTASGNLKSWNEQMESFLEARGKEEAGFYRAHLGNSPNANQNAIYGYAGMSQFASGNYAGLYKLMAKLGDQVNGVRFTQSGATDATDMIFGVRYRGRLSKASVDGDEQGPGYGLYERALPIGYAVSMDILGDMEMGRNPFENQNKLLSALCGSEVEVYRPADVYDYVESDAEYTYNGDRYEIRKKGDAEYGDVLFGIPRMGYEHAYASFQLFDESVEDGEKLLDADMAENVAVYSTADRKDSGARFEFSQGNSIVEMTPDGNAFYLRLAVFDGADKSYHYARQYFYYQDENTLDAAAAYLGELGWRVIRQGNTHIEAEFELDEERPLLFISIPYDKGWSALVDGEAAEILPAARGAFMAVYAVPGAHSIVLDYEAPGAAEGQLLSILGVIMLLGLLLADIKNTARHEAAGDRPVN